MYLYLPFSYTGKIVLSSDHTGKISLIADNSSLVIPYKPDNALAAAIGKNV